MFVYISLYIIGPVLIKPPRLGGGGEGTFANILPGGTSASFWSKFSQKLANVLLYSEYNNLYQKYIKNKKTLPVFRAAKCWQTFLFRHIFGGGYFWTSVLASPDVSGQLLSNKNALHTTRNQPDVTALTENAINLLKHPKNIKNNFRTFPNFPKFKNSKSGGLDNNTSSHDAFLPKPNLPAVIV